MKWEIYLDIERTTCVYYPGDEKCVILNSVLKESLNSCHTLEFSIPNCHDLYNDILPRVTRLFCFRNEDYENPLVFEVESVEEDMNMIKSIYAVSELADLFCSIQSQARYQDISVIRYFTTLIDKHNEQVEEKKKFLVGIVTAEDPNDSLYRYTNYETTLDVMRSDLCKSLNAYLRVRRQNGKRYLDLVKFEDYGKTCLQPIEFGVNLLDYSNNLSTSDIATAVIPLGAKIENEDGSYVQRVQGLDAYTTVESVNDGKDYISSKEAVDQFGWIKRIVEFENVTEPKNLLKKGQEWLYEKQFANMQLELNAIDLNELDANIDSFDIGDTVEALAIPFGLDIWLPVQEKTTYLQQPERNTIILSRVAKAGYIEQANDAMNEVTDSVPQISSILNSALKNATNIINGNGENGYVVLHQTDEGKPFEILIMDTPDIRTAKKVWRFNNSGLGYSSTGYDGTYGLAMTMDGAIVADRITAGILSGDRVRGGTIEVGGTGFGKDGEILVKDINGNVLCTINNKGMEILKGKVDIITGDLSGTHERIILEGNSIITEHFDGGRERGSYVEMTDGQIFVGSIDSSQKKSRRGSINCDYLNNWIEMTTWDGDYSLLLQADRTLFLKSDKNMEIDASDDILIRCNGLSMNGEGGWSGVVNTDGENMVMKFENGILVDYY